MIQNADYSLTNQETCCITDLDEPSGGLLFRIEDLISIGFGFDLDFWSSPQ